MKYIIRAYNISKSIGGKILFENTSFNISKNDCIGIIGSNGCGKTTFFKILKGLKTPDEGEIWSIDNINIEYLEQIALPNINKTIKQFLIQSYQEKEIRLKIKNFEKQLENPEIYNSHEYEIILEKINLLKISIGHKNYKNQINETLNILEDIGMKNISLNENINNLSGGEKQKIALANLFSNLENTDLLLLDEPTNHLDIETIEWLEEKLADFSKTVLIITHDRYLLDDLVDRVFEFQGAKIEYYDTTFEEYEKQKNIRQHLKNQIIRKAIIDEKRHRSTIAKMTRRNRFDSQISSKIKRFNKEKRPDNQIFRNYLLRFNFQNVFKSGKNIADGVDICKGFNSKIIFNNANFEILSGQKIGLIGPNGCGKTTFLRLLIGEDNLDSGVINVSKGVKCGYFDQGNLSLDIDNIMLDEVLKDNKELNENDAKALLGQFNFHGDSYFFRQIKKLSGGEIARLGLLKLLIKPYNLLILDEPTNHMDMHSKKIVENAINSYNGTIIVVSHDRKFLDNVTDKIFLIRDNLIESYKGNYSMYRFQILGGNTNFYETDFIEVSGKYLKRYVVKSSFTEWQTHKKYKIGDEILIDERNFKLFEWAINTGKIMPKRRVK